MRFYSPLRYPGGKGKLSNYMKEVIKENSLSGGTYVELFAGGCAIALTLLIDKYVSEIVINDISKPIYSFWHSVLEDCERLCKKIKDTPVTVDEWYKQKEIQQDIDNHDTLDIGFSTFYLNRTNRSGILTGGVIGGLSQKGDWKIDARYNKDNLVKRIERIAIHSDKIGLFNLDAEEFIRDELTEIPENTLVYLDPPYYNKGKHLYENYYDSDDHSKLANTISGIKHKWIVTYDNIKEIEELYGDYEIKEFSLNYSAARKYEGSEIMIFSEEVNIPPDIQSIKAI